MQVAPGSWWKVSAAVSSNSIAVTFRPRVQVRVRAAVQCPADGHPIAMRMGAAEVLHKKVSAACAQRHPTRGSAAIRVLVLCALAHRPRMRGTHTMLEAKVALLDTR